MKLGFLSTLQTVGTLSTKIAIVAAASIGGTALVSSSVFATLTATATQDANVVTSGKMSLAQAPGANSGGASGGFATTITNMAPLDSVVRLVTLTNASTLDSASMTVSVTDTTPTVLTTGSTGFAGLSATIHQCAVAYTQASPGAVYVCPLAGGGGSQESTVKSSSTILSMASAQTMTMASLSAGAGAFLKITITLPDVTENTLNGAAPGAGSVQSKSASLNWTITATQRSAATTNS